MTSTIVQTSAASASTIVVTITTSTRTTETFTDTTTTTPVQTVTVPLATAYAQCEANNVANSGNGGYALNVAVSLANYKFVERGTQNPTACCNLCAATEGCGGYAALPYDPLCFHFLPKTPRFCDASMAAGRFTSLTGSDPQNGYVLGSGQCGWLRNEGDIVIFD